MLPRKYTGSTPEAARYLINEGLRPVPVPAGYKGPNRAEDKYWQDKTWTVDDFADGDNIGLHLVNIGMVDRDCDEARALVGKFLPHTRMSGRKSEPRSHAWYWVTGEATTKQIRDTDGAMIIELRHGHGKQTLVPPSVHPDHHEPYVTYNEDTPIPTISAEELLRGVRLEAAAAQIAKSYPKSGGRHFFGLYLAGFLLRNKENPETVYDLMLAARELKGPMRKNTALEILKVINSTVAKLGEGAKVAGGPTLKAEYDEKLPDKLAKILGWNKTDWNEDGAPGEDRRSQADRLIQYALDGGVPLFLDQFQAPHTLVDGEAVPLTSRSYNWLRGLFWEKETRSINGEALKTAAGTLAAFAAASEDVRELYTRAAFVDGALYYQLGRARVVQIDRAGWRMIADPPVVFRNVSNLKALPDPERGGGFEALDALMNLKSKRDKRLFRAYVVTLPLEHVQRYIFQPTGVMGSGKSTASRAVKRALDPTAPESVRIDPREFLQKASHSFIVMLDNQNSLPEWAVDTLCRLVTGEADSKRRHYTDDEDFIYEMKRAIVMNGINAPADRSDAQDRTLPIELDRIPDEVRIPEEELWEAFEEAHGRVLGAIFDALSKTLAKRPEIKLTKRPRLADWGYYAAAVYEVLGWGSKLFEEDWQTVVESQNRETFDGSALAQAIVAIMEHHDVYSAKPDKLLDDLETQADVLKIDTKRDKKWPGSPTWVYRRIREVMTTLNSKGITVERGRDKESREILISKGGAPTPPNDSSDDSRSADDSIFGDAVTDAVTENPPKVSGIAENSDIDDSSDSIPGGFSPSLTSRGKEGDKVPGVDLTHPSREVPRSAVTAVTAVTDPEISPPEGVEVDVDLVAGTALKIGGPAGEGESGIRMNEDGSYMMYVADEDALFIAAANLAIQAMRLIDEGEEPRFGIDMETTTLTPEEGGRIRLIQLSCRKVTCVFDCDYVDAKTVLELIAATKNDEE